MYTIFKRFAIYLFVFCLFAAPLASGAFAQDAVNDREEQAATEEMVFDALIVRPVGIVGTIFGCGVFIVSLPFSVLADNVPGAFNTLVTQPAKYTFRRPLGDF
ncbi:MAG: hypothetical protein RBR01_06605 [Desulfobacterales bacterium]|jgi:hypothetical protein|nr:hypothetical protein [Desulfobacterales bacterium]MDD3952170.1 hypothetical protein [Desulfobacterales bacterium]MDY0378093.1 hypothetical protein [Desulfobacterales bacterium]